MKMPPPIATKFTKLVLTILAITILGIILSFISQDHTLLMLSAGVAVAGGVKIIDYYADAARKKDICWDVMRKIAVDTVEKRYQKCVRAFETKDLTDFGPLCRILDEGISAWGEMLYLKGETLDEYKARKGATDMDRYMCHTYAFVDRNGDWTGSGDMGWFGISSNDKDERAWNDEIQKLMNEAKDDDFLAIVDCHI